MVAGCHEPDLKLLRRLSRRHVLDHDAITFGLAIAGYIVLAKDAALRIAGRRWPVLGVLTALLIVPHVLLVWAFRFEWSLRYAWDKSPPGFVIFHAALLLIAIAPILRGRARDRTTWLAFTVVSAGALPAPFRYEELGILAIPLLSAFAAVVAVWYLRRKDRAFATRGAPPSPSSSVEE